MLERVDWTRDLHFQTCTTIDTLDYSGDAVNEGSKAGDRRRRAAACASCRRRSVDLRLPDGFRTRAVCLPGVLAVQGPRVSSRAGAADRAIERFCDAFQPDDPINRFPLIVVVDDSEFTARTLNNFLWVTFTRSNPAADVHGDRGRSCEQKHWGCRGLAGDRRPHQAAPRAAAGRRSAR